MPGEVKQNRGNRLENEIEELNNRLKTITRYLIDCIRRSRSLLSREEEQQLSRFEDALTGVKHEEVPVQEPVPFYDKDGDETGAGQGNNKEV